MAEILHRWRGNYPLPPPINRGFVDDLRKEKYQVQSQPKTSHFPLFLQFFSLSSPSLSTVAFCNHHSNHRCFVTFSTTSGHLNSSPAAKHTPPVGLSLQHIFFSIFLPALPPATSSNRRPHHRTSSSTTRPPPCHVAFFFFFFSSTVFALSLNSRREFLLFTHEQWAWIKIHVHYSCSGLYLL